MAENATGEARRGPRFARALAPGTEDVYKIYAESFLGHDHFRRIQEEARASVDEVRGGE